MAEPHITKLERHKRELLEAYKAVIEWHEAMEHARTTSRKSDAYKVADEKYKIMEETRKIIEPILAE